MSRQRRRSPLPERRLVAWRDLGPLCDGRFQAVELVGRGVGSESNAVDRSRGGIGRERGADLRENFRQTIQRDKKRSKPEESRHFTGFARENRTIQVRRLGLNLPPRLRSKARVEGFALSPDLSRDEKE